MDRLILQADLVDVGLLGNDWSVAPGFRWLFELARWAEECIHVALELADAHCALPILIILHPLLVLRPIRAPGIALGSERVQIGLMVGQLLTDTDVPPVFHDHSSVCVDVLAFPVLEIFTAVEVWGIILFFRFMQLLHRAQLTRLQLMHLALLEWPE